MPATGCHGTLPAGAALILKDQVDDAQDQFGWRLGKSTATTVGDFHDPVNGSAVYHVCVYDGSARPQPLLHVDVPAGGTCGTRPCWKPTRTGFSYSSRAATVDGVTAIKLAAGIDGKAKVHAKGKGILVPMPTLGLGFPVTAQLVIRDGVTTECWQTTLSAARQNDATRFNGRGP